MLLILSIIFQKSKLISLLFEITDHEILIQGIDEKDWIKSLVLKLSNEDIRNSYAYFALDLIQLYHNLNEPIADDQATLDFYAPHKKYKVIPQLYIQLARSLLETKKEHEDLDDLEKERLKYINSLIEFIDKNQGEKEKLDKFFRVYYDKLSSDKKIQFSDIEDVY